MTDVLQLLQMLLHGTIPKQARASPAPAPRQMQETVGAPGGELDQSPEAGDRGMSGMTPGDSILSNYASKSGISTDRELSDGKSARYNKRFTTTQDPTWMDWGI